MLFQNVQNYYEKLVSEEIAARNILADFGQDYMEDVTCLALNKLPPRYIRFEVDMGFYLEEAEAREMRQHVQDALDNAIEFLDEKQKQKPIP